MIKAAKFLKVILQEWRKNVLGKINVPCVRMMNMIDEGKEKGEERLASYVSCDAFLAGVILKPDMATEVVAWHADIELHGNRTRGQVVLDHLLSNKPNVNLIQKFDSELFKKTLIRAVNVFGDYQSVLV